MSPVGSTLRERIRDYPALVSCCQINWLSRWPNQALEAMSTHFLNDLDKVHDLQKNLSEACSLIHLGGINLADLYNRK